MAMLIGLTGRSRAGKNEAADAFGLYGVKVASFSDFIKQDLNVAIQRRLGIHLHDCTDEEKHRLRPIMEIWGMVSYIEILNELMAKVDEWLKDPIVHLIVSPRVMQLPEVYAWKQRGAFLVEIVRPGVGPATSFEEKNLEAIRPFLDATVLNDGTKGDLHRNMRKLLRSLRGNREAETPKEN
jgi:hypothetical protein